MGHRDYCSGDENIRIESIINKILGNVFKNCGQDLFLLSEKNKITTEYEMAISLIAVKAFYVYCLYLNNYEESNFDIQDERGLLVKDMMGSVFDAFEDTLSVLSDVDKIENEFEERICLLASTVLSAYYAYTSEVDEELGIPCDINYFEHKLSCGNKLNQCQEKCDKKTNIFCYKNKKSVKINHLIKVFKSKNN